VILTTIWWWQKLGRDWQSENKKRTVYMERFNLRKLNEAEGNEQYRVEISNKFAALENLDAEVDINRALKTAKQNINISAKESLGYY
jgi:hypothetical protein